MRHKIISLSQAKAKLLEFSRRVYEEGEAFILTKDGQAVSVLAPLEDYEALLETEDVNNNSQTMANLNEALSDEKKSKLWRRDNKGQWQKVQAGHSSRTMRPAKKKVNTKE